MQNSSAESSCAEIIILSQRNSFYSAYQRVSSKGHIFWPTVQNTKVPLYMGVFMVSEKQKALFSPDMYTIIVKQADDMTC